MFTTQKQSRDKYEPVVCTDKRILGLSRAQNQQEVFQSINQNKVVREPRVKRTAGQTKFMKMVKRGWKKRNPDHQERLLAKFSVN